MPRQAPNFRQTLVECSLDTLERVGSPLQTTRQQNRDGTRRSQQRLPVGMTSCASLAKQSCIVPSRAGSGGEVRRGVRGSAQAEQRAAGVGEGPPALAGRLPAGGSAKQELALFLTAADLPHQRVEHIVDKVAQGRRCLVERAVHLRRQSLALLRAHLRTRGAPLTSGPPHSPPSRALHHRPVLICRPFRRKDASDAVLAWRGPGKAENRDPRPTSHQSTSITKWFCGVQRGGPASSRFATIFRVEEKSSHTEIVQQFWCTCFFTQYCRKDSVDATTSMATVQPRYSRDAQGNQGLLYAKLMEWRT